MTKSTITRDELNEVIATYGKHHIAHRMANLLLAAMDSEPVAVIDLANLDYLLSGADADVWPPEREEMGDVLLYRHPQPAPVVPEEWTIADAVKFCKETGRQDAGAAMDAWNACRAAMLQAGTLTNEGTIPVTQFKPVADLYGLTSPTGSETSFTFDAVEARDFIDGGWSCQEYVELERFHEAITNHTEDKLAMVDHSGDSNNMVEPVTTTYKLPFEQWLSKQTGTIDVEYGCVMTEVFFHWLRVAYDAGNSPVIADGWVLVPEEPTHEMLEAGDEQFGTYDVYRRMIAASPQQEVMP